MMPSLARISIALSCAIIGAACSSSQDASSTAAGPAPVATVAANGNPASADTGAAVGPSAAAGSPTGNTASPGPASSGSPAATCDAAQVSTWPSCVGKVVTIAGKDPGPNVQQHPVSATPPGASPIVELYMDVPGGPQIVLHAKKRVQCSGGMQVTGTLRARSLGGPANTKESYSGYYVDDADVKCL